MSLTVAIIAPGEMGTAIARGLIAHGVRVLTSLAGRSGASRERAQADGLVIVDDDSLVAQADFFLSIVPPGAAIGLAERLVPALSRADRKPVYIDCNAIAPDTALRIGAILEPANCRYVDAALFGGPTSGKPGVVMYASGPHASELSLLDGLGVAVRVMQGAVGAASALKLSFAGINKGYTALGALMVSAAARAGCTEELTELLASSQPALLAYIKRFVPAMFPKAWRWEPEMREIAAFLSDDEAGSEIFEAMAEVYARLAADVAAGGGGESEQLALFCTRTV